MTEIASNLHKLQEQIRETALSSGRDPQSVRLLAVSKTFPPAAIREAQAAGQSCFGENRVQEAREKVPALAHLQVEWHLIGHLQSNKARLAAELFDVIQSVDSPRIAGRLDAACRELGKVLPVMIQVNVGHESQKYGIESGDLPEVVSLIDGLPCLRLEGLMSIPPWNPDPEASRPYFREMYRLFQQVNARRPQPLTQLSMGMSGDFQVAIQEGATLVRVGTALFGSRG